MKHLFYILLAALVLVSCEKEPETVTKFKLDPDAMIRMQPEGSVRLKAKSENEEYTHLSGLEIVKQASDIHFYSIPWEEYTGSAFGYNTEDSWYWNLRDTLSTPPALLMPAFRIIEPSDTSLVTMFIDCRDLIFRKITNLDKPDMVIDTIAYIPNDSLAAASVKIKKAFAENDHETVYELFNNLYKFTPVTGAEWRELKAKETEEGLN